MNSRFLLIAGFASALAMGAQAQAQSRVQAPAAPPAQPPGVQRPSVDPTNQAIAALKLQIEALQNSVGRQVVVLHFPAHDHFSWPDAENNFPANNARAEAMCKAGLGDRYGRVLSREARPFGQRWYFPNLVCETKP